jgi:hypothetical protein
MIYVLVKDSGTVIAKEVYAGSTETLDARKLQYPSYVYEEVTESVFNSEPEPTASNYLMT